MNVIDIFGCITLLSVSLFTLIAGAWLFCLAWDDLQERRGGKK
jgi:hypothetical protein